MDQQRLKYLHTMPYDEYLRTPEWKKKRANRLAQDRNQCALCTRSHKLEVHHRTYVRRGNELLEDLITLCDDCHSRHHRSMQINQAVEEVISQAIQSVPQPAPKQETDKLKRISWEDYLLGLLLHDPFLISHVCPILQEEDFLQEDNRAVYHLIHSISSDDPVEAMVPADLLPVVDRARQSVEDSQLKGLPPATEFQLKKNALQCAIRIKRANLLKKNQEIGKAIAIASQSDNREELRRLQIQQNDMFQQIRVVNSAMKLHG